MSSLWSFTRSPVARRVICELLIVLTLLGAAGGRAAAATVASFDLGFGFRVDQVLLPTGPNAWERYAQYRVLFYKNRELGIYDSYSIAPSGKYALFQDAPTEGIVLFTRATGKRQIVMRHPHSLAKKYTWREQRQQATVLFENGSFVRISLLRR